MSTPESNQTELRRELTLLDSTMINVGTIVGSGIFIVPATIALYVHYSGLVLLAWVVGGIASILGALSVAELGAAMPRAGGIYVYVREAYGEVWGFLYGWTAFAVTNTASISAIAVGFATYLSYLLPLSPAGIKLVAIASIIVLTAINCLGVKLGAWVQNILTLLKLAAFGGLLIMSAALSGGSLANFAPLFPQSIAGLLGPFGLAVLATLWAYDGWIEITFVAGEVRLPQRNVPMSIILSTIIVIVVYCAVNFAYLYVLSADGVAGSSFVASDTAVVLIGGLGATFIAIAVMVSTLGTNNGIVFTAARIPYAMAKERQFFQSFGLVHPRFNTPTVALVIQGVWACVLTLTGTYDQLITYVVFASFVFYGMAAAAVVVLRKRKPNMERPYKTWGYPATPILFVLFAIWLVANTIIEDPRDAAIGAGIILAGWPAYLYWKGKRG